MTFGTHTLYCSRMVMLCVTVKMSNIYYKKDILIINYRRAENVLKIKNIIIEKIVFSLYYFCL